jgi:hypothetical protein
MCMKHIFPMGFYFSIMLITYSVILRIGRTNRLLRYEHQFSWFIRQSRQKHMKPVLAIDERKNIDYFLHFLVRLGNINIFVKVWFGVWHYDSNNHKMTSKFETIMFNLYAKPHHLIQLICLSCCLLKASGNKLLKPE